MRDAEREVARATSSFWRANRIKSEAGSVMWMVAQEYRHENGRVEKDAHLALSENREIPFTPDSIESVVHNGGVKRMTGAKYGYASFFDQFRALHRLSGRYVRDKNVGEQRINRYTLGLSGAEVSPLDILREIDCDSHQFAPVFKANTNANVVFCRAGNAFRADVGGSSDEEVAKPEMTESTYNL